MAIIKQFETPQGVSANYHKIIRAEIRPLSEDIEIVVAIYSSAEARDQNKGVLWHEYVVVPFADLTQDPRDLLYPMLSYYVSSYLLGGQADGEGNTNPGNFEINLKPEAIGVV